MNTSANRVLLAKLSNLIAKMSVKGASIDEIDKVLRLARDVYMAEKIGTYTYNMKGWNEWISELMCKYNVPIIP